VDRVLTAARRLLIAGPAASWIAAWALAGRGWPIGAIARALGTDSGTVILAIVRVRNTPEYLALASSLLRFRLSGHEVQGNETLPSFARAQWRAGTRISPRDQPQMNAHPYCP
jgi:hypothetical protein